MATPKQRNNEGEKAEIMPVDLVEDELASGSLVLLPEEPALPRVSYCAAYMTSEAAAIMFQVIAIARIESRFMAHAALNM